MIHQRVYDFGNRIAERLSSDNQARDLEHVASGKISGSKLGQPTLWAVLQIIGVPRELDPYLLGKFKRGNDVEARAVEFLTSIPMHEQPNFFNEWVPVIDSPISGEVNLQKESGYRGGCGYIDMAQRNEGVLMMHEIKSSTKSSYDKVAAVGRYKGIVNEEKGVGVPYTHHAIQLAYYCLGEKAPHGFLHYFNADDYRLTSFLIDPQAYKTQVDNEIDAIERAFTTQRLPVYEPFLPYHKAYKRDTYGAWNNLGPDELMDKLIKEYPVAHKLFTQKGNK